MVLILQRERRPEEVSSGLLAETGSLREEPGSPLKQFRVAAGHAFRCRSAILLTKSVPRTKPRLAGSQPRQRRERSEARRHKLQIARLRQGWRRLVPSAAPPFPSKANGFAWKKEEGGNKAQFSSTLTETERRELLLTFGRGAFFLFSRRKERMGAHLAAPLCQKGGKQSIALPIEAAPLK